ncbi:response regulator transcription factor [Vibrio sp.]|uniref:DNA-binding response regulator n=1 Tax=Vibrio viridaestus TaxID=2487322 RepID=A0A3N9TL65_9VIBR|nr:response regulator transcription factor [Vibrio viridaestus]MDC0609850.1 response regulator transcription factor [Vibrio sp.]RQW64724.1 DNA-binding response regulator [Vibrio viridaestus]
MLSSFELSRQELNLFSEIIWDINSPGYRPSLRGKALKKITALLNADCGASYVVESETGVSSKGISYNIDSKAIQEHDSYWQFNDPITSKLRQRRTATTVEQVISRNQFEKTGFYNEFLKPNKMHHGINVYFVRDNIDVGDMRIWRSCGAPEFGDKERMLLDTLAPYFSRSLPNTQEESTLTRKEQEITTFICKGFTDKEIAQLLGISHSTVRTHIKHIFDKLDCSNRTELVSIISQSL